MVPLDSFTAKVIYENFFVVSLFDVFLLVFAGMFFIYLAYELYTLLDRDERIKRSFLEKYGQVYDGYRREKLKELKNSRRRIL